ncbi:SWIM zinc finger family protein [Halococcus salifodinae]|uniref:Zinc finger SWIM domain-containing protein n=1 Tax=Halococcus salifodinae DSM 8989 TaxID=1227456 RepID=M0MSR8_9EURY|nr:SWIM zinc finger family protein [Halococcus salifodinae]EMA47794.1 zinc finger SWIM domain-containing protein [Halococcus salifodinae DSM 8989]
MNAYEPNGQERTDDERRGVEAVAKRVTRALDSFFHVEAAGDNGKYTVLSGSGNTYTVDPSDGSCTCPDGQRGSWCKHAHRVAFVTGEIPDIDGVRVESSDKTDDTDADTETETDDSQTLAERVEQFAANNPGASAIEAIGQLGISPDKKERVEEVLAA